MSFDNIKPREGTLIQESVGTVSGSATKIGGVELCLIEQADLLERLNKIVNSLKDKLSNVLNNTPEIDACKADNQQKESSSLAKVLDQNNFNLERRIDELTVILKSIDL